MSVAPRELLQLAKELISNGSEVKNRTAAGRIYYSIYQATEWLDEILSSHGGIAEKSGIHTARISKFQYYPTSGNLEKIGGENIGSDCARTIRSIGHMMANIYTLRIKADYKPKDTFTADEVMICFLSAEKLLIKLETLREDPKIAKIISSH
jgi:uncharacterized protein (UPF0332 family)